MGLVGVKLSNVDATDAVSVSLAVLLGDDDDVPATMTVTSSDGDATFVATLAGGQAYRYLRSAHLLELLLIGKQGSSVFGHRTSNIGGEGQSFWKRCRFDGVCKQLTRFN